VILAHKTGDSEKGLQIFYILSPFSIIRLNTM